MYDQLEIMQTAVDDIEEVPVFGYSEAALESDDYIPGHNEYSDSNLNNIPLTNGTELSLQEIEKGFRDTLSTLSRAFFTHFFGRSSFNLNKMKNLFSDVLDTCKADYTHNFRAWDSTAVYAAGDVCFLVANGIRYCFKSLVDNNTATISSTANGVLSYNSSKWVLLNELRTVQHPIGKPFLWFGGNLPSNCINFSNNAQYNFSAWPKLNTTEFRALLTRFTWKGARADTSTFTVPNFTSQELYPMCYSSLPDTLSTIGAKVPAHWHYLSTGSVDTNSTYHTDHYHSMDSTYDSGSHNHYTGDYYTASTISTAHEWHEDSKFQGASRGEDNTNYLVSLTPTLKAAAHGSHTVTAYDTTYDHAHSGTVTPSGAGNFDASSGKYRPGTIKAILAIRAN